MDRRTVLKMTGCDLKGLPVGVRAAFVLSQLDGYLSLEEIAEVVGFELDEVLELGKLLVEVGAVVEVTARAPVRTRPETAPRPDPRAEPSVPPQSTAREVRSEPRSAAERSVGERPLRRPSPFGGVRRPSTRLEARRSRKSSRAMQAVVPQAAPADPATDLDPATVERITSLDAKLVSLDHYGVLGVDRHAEKKAIKQAYFRFAATYHPDRFFGKKLGSVRAPLERIFQRATDAQATLIDPKLRAEYDRTLPPAPPPASGPPPAKETEHEATSSTPRRRSNRGMRAPSRRGMAAVAVAPAESVVVSPSATTAVIAKAEPAPDPVVAAPPPVVTASRAEVGERTARFRAAALEVRVQAHIDLLVKAAEDALKSNDLAGAANNYRLALSHRDDPHLRIKFEEIDARARIVRFEKNIGPARAAEKEERWAEAAVFFERAYEAKPDADVAASAANAIRRSAGDLRRAVTLAEHAASRDAKNVGHQIVLAEVYLAANKWPAAEEASARAAALAPKDARTKELAALVASRKKA
jgi:DnaJ-domain-containing protein 1